MKRDAKWWRWKYLFQNMLSTDKIYMETIEETRESIGNGARQESSLPFVLHELACQMADVECSETRIKHTNRAYAKWFSYTEHPKVEELRRTDALVLTVQEVDIDMYHAFLDKLDQSLRMMLDETVVTNKYYLVTNEKHGCIGGFGTNETGYMTGLFSLKRGYGRKIFPLRLQQAIIDSATETKTLTIFCTGMFLRDFYKEHGFRVDRITEWNTEFADENWNYLKFGTPNLYHMSRHINYGIKS